MQEVSSNRVLQMTIKYWCIQFLKGYLPRLPHSLSTSTSITTADTVIQVFLRSIMVIATYLNISVCVHDIIHYLKQKKVLPLGPILIQGLKYFDLI
jgi:hypothetical protein